MSSWIIDVASDLPKDGVDDKVEYTTSWSGTVVFAKSTRNAPSRSQTLLFLLSVGETIEQQCNFGLHAR
jgi:hypothetical protein